MANVTTETLKLDDKLSGPMKKAIDEIEKARKSMEKVDKQTQQIGKTTNSLGNLLINYFIKSISKTSVTCSDLSIQISKSTRKMDECFNTSLIQINNWKSNILQDCNEINNKNIKLIKNFKDIGNNSAPSLKKARKGLSNISNSSVGVSNQINKTSVILIKFSTKLNNVGVSTEKAKSKNKSFLSTLGNLYDSFSDQCGKVNNIVDCYKNLRGDTDKSIKTVMSERLNKIKNIATSVKEKSSCLNLSRVKRALRVDTIRNIATNKADKVLTHAVTIKNKAYELSTNMLKKAKKALNKENIRSNITKAKDKIVSKAAYVQEKVQSKATGLLTVAKKALRKETLKNTASNLRGKVVGAAVYIQQKAQTVGTLALAAAQKVLNAAFRANPLGMIITGIVVVLGVFALLYNRVKAVRDICKSVFKFAGKIFSFFSGGKSSNKKKGISISGGPDTISTPKLAHGTSNWRGGLAITQEKGAEIMDLPRGTRVYPHDKSLQMAKAEGARGSSGSSISINISKLADKLEVRSDNDIDAIAGKLANKLEKIMNNVGKVEFA
ncbi:hypothetical protein [Anaeromicropila herbilytica]|uniref:Uncharacterized protein n=1 Tax=Anaeromicropila herbilytica TaxID=2785025 RepID=A0A7R7ENI3_9FIRM|nr:hypothetical protein [Anaeromicropila herbilytica]BCN32067.1 hypothetical protein bsdtb5_33620 [Anaeromicropila herbilytica]